MTLTLEQADMIARQVWGDPQYLRERERVERDTWAMWQALAGTPGYLGRRFAGQLDCPMPFAPAGTLTAARYLDADGGQLWPPDWSWPMWNHNRLDHNRLDRAMGRTPYRRPRWHTWFDVLLYMLFAAAITSAVFTLAGWV